MSWYSSYNGHSLGRILHFIGWYCGLHVAERVELIGDTLFIYGERLATVTWEGDIPKFQFVDSLLMNEQRRLLRAAIEDLK